MELRIIADRQALSDHFKADPYLNLYNLADLDDSAWDQTTYYSSQSTDPAAVVMVHDGLVVPILSAMTNENGEEMGEIVRALIPKLASKIYGNFTPGLVKVVESDFDCQSFGDHYRMGLIDPSMLLEVSSKITPVGVSEQEAVRGLVHRSMDDYWFDPKMLGTNCYFGYLQDSKLVGVGGVHMVSLDFGVAALGNVATDDRFRRKGIASQVVSAVCQNLLAHLGCIGLNVKCDNIPAIKCYEALGFEITHRYQEFMMTRKK